MIQVTPADVRRTVANAVGSIEGLSETRQIVTGPEGDPRSLVHKGYQVQLPTAINTEEGRDVRQITVEQDVIVRVSYRLSPARNREQIDDWDDLCGDIEPRIIDVVLTACRPMCQRAYYVSTSREITPEWIFLDVVFSVKHPINLNPSTSTYP